MNQTQTPVQQVSNLVILLSLIMLVVPSIIARQLAWKEMRWPMDHKQCSTR